MEWPPELKYEEIEKYTNSKSNFITKFQIGSVYRASIGESQHFIVKIWDNDARLGAGPLAEELYELRVMDKNGVKGIPKIIGYCEDERYPRAILYDLNPLDTVHNLIPKDDFTWPQRIKVSLGFASILMSFHNGKFSYIIRNIDAAHIMCDQEYNPILYDIGMFAGGSLYCRWKYDGRKGSRGYIDPYFNDTGDCSDKTDVFAYGVVLLGLISKKLFNAETDSDTDFLDKWAERVYYKGSKSKRPSLADSDFSSSPYFSALDGHLVTNLAMRCIKYKPEKRPSMEEVVKELGRLEIVRKHGDMLGVQKWLTSNDFDV